MKVHSPRAARELLERNAQLVAKAVGSLLIGATEFFREPGVFEYLRTQVLPALAGRNIRLRIWSAACSTGAELYSMAILLSEAGLLERSYLLGTDCNGEAIERAKLGVYDAAALKLVRGATRDGFFEPAGRHWRPVEALRRHVHWKAADLLAGVEKGPWDIIFWRNTAIYLESGRAEAIWRRLASALAPAGVLVAGKAERPPGDAGLTQAARCIYRLAEGPATDPADSRQRSLPPRSMGNEPILEHLL
jgi:chemotaxis methyl-accepting protein methylase